MSDRPSYQFELEFDIANGDIKVHATDVLPVLTALRTEIEEYIEKQKKIINNSEKYKKSYLREVQSEIDYQQGYIKGIDSFMFLMGDDNYYHHCKPCEETFQEYKDGFRDQPKIWGWFKYD
jgi:hypothetical protein